jgi:hypothetical protein
VTTTCEKLVDSGKYEVAEHYAKQIWKSILEAKTLDFVSDKKGNLLVESTNSNFEK